MKAAKERNELRSDLLNAIKVGCEHKISESEQNHPHFIISRVFTSSEFYPHWYPLVSENILPFTEWSIPNFTVHPCFTLGQIFDEGKTGIEMRSEIRVGGKWG